MKNKNKIILTKSLQNKINGKWVNTQNRIIENKEITVEEYYNICCKSTISFFKSLGGKEIVYRNYLGLIYKLISISPLGDERAVYLFDFKNCSQNQVLNLFSEIDAERKKNMQRGDYYGYSKRILRA